MNYDLSNFNETCEIISGKKEYKHDIAVLLIFFNRPSKIKEVFSAVKEARPSKLYLYQDGIRNGRKDDIEKVKACRKIVEEIDWDCTVHKMYQEENFGCDPSGFIAHKWMFSYEEMGIVLEDDVVPSQSFFSFCIELLNKYRYDNRIAIVCGMNNFDVSKEIDESYFFSKHGSIWGWASWKRFIDLWEPSYLWLKDNRKIETIKNYCYNSIDFEEFKLAAEKHAATGKAHFESIMFAAAALNDMLNIVPKYNMISNIGVDAESTHSVSDVRLLCRRTQKLMYKKVYDIDFPLVHPSKIELNKKLDNKYIRRKYQKVWDRFEVLVRRIIFTGHIFKKK